MTTEERNDRLWLLARKRARGEMTKEDEQEKAWLQNEESGVVGRRESMETIVERIKRLLWR